MRLSIQLVLVGVGSWIAFSNVAPGASETVQSQAPSQPAIASTSGVQPDRSTARETQPSWWTAARPSPASPAARPVPEAQAAPEAIVVPTESTQGRPVWLSHAAVSSPPPAVTVPTSAAPVIPRQVAQVVDPTLRIPDKPIPPATLDPSQRPNLPIIVSPVGPAKPGPAPSYLNPDPNPLLFPTKPGEVQLQGVQPITLQQAIELAERNSRTLQISVQQLERSRAGLRQQQAALYPTVGIQSGITTSQSAGGQLSQQAQSQNPFQTGNADRNSTSFSGSLNLDYNIFTFGLRPAQIRAAEQQVRSDELQVEITREQLRLDVANDYYNLQEADEFVRIYGVSVDTNRINVRDAEQLRDAGLGTQFSVLQANVDLALARQQLSQGLAQVQIRRRQLAVRIAAPLTIDLAAADPIQVAGNWNLTLDNSILLAVKNRAELEQFLAQRRLSNEQRKAALAQLAPVINLTAQYNVLDSFNDSFGLADGYSATLGLRWNFFDGGAARARADQQSANIAIAELNFADGRDQIRFQVEQAYATLAFNSENISTTGQAVAQGLEAVRLAFLRREAGVGTELEVRNAISSLTDAQGRRVQAILGYNRALASLQRAITNAPPGSITPRGGVMLPTSSLIQDLKTSLPRQDKAMLRVKAGASPSSPAPALVPVNAAPVRTDGASLLSSPALNRGTLP